LASDEAVPLEVSQRGVAEADSPSSKSESSISILPACVAGGLFSAS
jgi:hypothetical protein